MRTIPFIVALLWLALLPQQLLAYYCPKTQTSDLPFSSVNTYSMGHETISTTQGTWSLEYHCPRGQFQTSASRLEGGVLADELYESGSYGTTKPQRSLVCPIAKMRITCHSNLTLEQCSFCLPWQQCICGG